MKVKFEIRESEGQKVIYINGFLFNWCLDEMSLTSAKRFVDRNPTMKKAVHGDIKKFFLGCLGEVLGREVTMKEVNKALETGWIESE